jgi:hypothetical protein
MSNAADFEIEIWYFKPSGKLYCTDKSTLKCTNIGTEGSPICFMEDVRDHFHKLRRDNQPAPGLSGSGRHFFMVVNCKEGHPVLIHPWGESPEAVAAVERGAELARMYLERAKQDLQEKRTLFVDPAGPEPDQTVVFVREVIPDLLPPDFSWCCATGCRKQATVRITSQTPCSVDDYTESCPDHVEFLSDGRKDTRVEPLR